MAYKLFCSIWSFTSWLVTDLAKFSRKHCNVNKSIAKKQHWKYSLSKQIWEDLLWKKIDIDWKMLPWHKQMNSFYQKDGWSCGLYVCIVITSMHMTTVVLATVFSQSPDWSLSLILLGFSKSQNELWPKQY